MKRLLIFHTLHRHSHLHNTSTEYAEKLKYEARSTVNAIQAMAPQWSSQIEDGSMPLPQLQAAIGRLKDVKAKLKQTLGNSEVTILIALAVLRDMALARWDILVPHQLRSPALPVIPMNFIALQGVHPVTAQ